MIRAEIYCDNDVGGPIIPFDATDWFRWADDGQIIGLREEGFGGGYESDSVAEYTAERDKLLSQFFSYLEFRHTYGSGSGMTVRVNADDAEAWIAEHRPHLAAKVDV